MRKHIAIVLVICTLLLMSSCAPTYINGEYPETFTGEANGVSMNNVISVTVSEKYNKAYGKIINVKMDGLDDLDFRKGDELKIKCESVETTYPLTITASDIRLKHRKNHSNIGSEYYGHGPYTIPDVSDLTVPKEFPDLSDRTVCEKKHSNWSFYVFRIVSIEEDRVYLTGGTGNIAKYVLYGSLGNDSFVKGDFVKIDVRYHYEKKDLHYLAAFSEDVIEVKKVTLAEAEDIIKGMQSILKPVIYLYPTKETNVKVDLSIKGELTCTYPEYKNGWNVKALPDGTLYDEAGNEYYCLYWEAQLNTDFDFNKGFCVSGNDTADFLREKLLDIGLTPREANEFIIFWLPVMQNNKYNVISFQTDRYEDAAKLLIEPKPESVLRVYMTFYESDDYIVIEPQVFKSFTRSGFTVVEWGGSQIK